MEKNFILTVKPGSVIHRNNGNRQTLTDVPENALELWEGGSATLCLRKDGAGILVDFTKERLEKVLNLRRNINYVAELKLLEDALKASGKAKKTPITDKEE